MRKFKIFVDMDKEEKYLNEMARKGYHLKKYTVFGFYHFEKGTPADLNYRVDYRVFNKTSDFEDYKALFEDAGWRHVYGTKSGYNQYFLPKDETVDDDIFSTQESKAARYKTLIDVCIMSFVLVIVYCTTMFASYDFNFANMGFLTPGLWQKNGSDFWQAFFFELPFAFLRTVPIVIFLIIGVLYAVWALKARKIFKEQNKV